MRKILDNRMLESIPLVERTIESSNNELLVIYNVVGDLDFDITLRKVYLSYDKLEESLKIFLSHEEKYKENILVWDDEFPIKQDKAKKELFFRFDNKKLCLPDHGEGFIFDGDVDYMRSWINKL